MSGLTNISLACRFLFSLDTHTMIRFLYTHRRVIHGQLVVHYSDILTYCEYILYVHTLIEKKVIVYILYTLHFVCLCFKQIIFFFILDFNPDTSGTAKSKNRKIKKIKKMNNTENVQFPASCLITTN